MGRKIAMMLGAASFLVAGTVGLDRTEGYGLSLGMPARAGWFTDTYNKVVSKVSDTAKAAYQKAGALCDKGVSYVKGKAKEVWDGIKEVDCGKIVDGLSGFDITTIFLDKLWAPAGVCLREFRKGFICGIPDMIKTLYQLGRGSIEAAWANKTKCFGTAFLAGPMGPSAFAMCGLYYYAKPKVQKMVGCIKSLSQSGNMKLFWKVLWEEAWKLGCNVLGSIAMDVVLDVLSAGVGTIASVAKWVKKLADLLSPAVWMKIANKIGQKAVDSTISYMQNVAKRVYECK
jgi:hypothetical protein